MRRTFAAVALALVTASAVPARAAFEDTGAGARALGMGNAFSAISDDAQAGVYNPAGLARLKRPEFHSSYGRLHMGLDDGSGISAGHFAYAHPLGGKRGAAALSWGQLNLLGLYQENAVRLAHGFSLRDGLDVGIVFKRLMVNVGQDQFTARDPVFEFGGKDSSGAWGVDVGVQRRVHRRLRLGAALQDLNRPDLGFGATSRQPIGLRAGAAYPGKDMKLALDLYRRDGEVKFYGGIERNLDPRFALRGGLGLGSGEFGVFSLGFGATERIFRLDYAFLYPLSGLSAPIGTHRFSLSVFFGRPVEEEDSKTPQAAAPPDKMTVLESELETLKKKLETLESAPPAPAARRPPERGTPAPPYGGAAAEEGSRAVPSRHIVQRGDTLPSLAQRYYGDVRRWVDLYKANREAIGPGGELREGLSLTLPPRSRK